MYQGDQILAEAELEEEAPRLEEEVPQSAEEVPRSTQEVPRSAQEVPQSADDGVLPNFLEADQLAAETSRPVPRAQLSPRVRAALWALRVFVVVVGAMVIYVFFAQLGH